MATHEDANLILRLYELRRETVLRQARNWFVRDFHPTSAASIMDVLKSEQSAFFRMVTTYWEMAATLVVHGTIDAALFHEANGEHLYVYAKLAPHLAELRQLYNNKKLAMNLEKLVLSMPDAANLIKTMQERQAGAAAARGGR
ncbi:MAG TPA: hypothetical protein VIC32_10120 [Terriglobales bacterium]|jgi:hypothetical protein